MTRSEIVSNYWKRIDHRKGENAMPTLIERPSIIQAAGTKPKRIEEYAGRVNSGHSRVSVARMISPEGWLEPGQQPEFEEITIVLKGLLRVESKEGKLDVRAGQAVVAHPGEWVRYSTPEPGGAEYVAICLPAFSMETVHRDE
jgi:mannose-6-phosphate isomerase-like protein (cupin superfamily)